MLSKEEIPNHWEIKLVEDVIINAKNGGTPKRSEDDYWDGNIQWLSSGEVSKGNIYSADEKITEKGLEESSAKLFPKNSILVAMYGKTRGKSAILRKQMSGNQALCCLETDDSEIRLEYLHYYLKRIRDQMASEGRGGGQDNINQSVILNQKVPVPPLDEQEMIVKKLDDIFDNIEEIQDAQDQAENILEDIPSSVLKTDINEDIEKKTAEELCNYIQRGKQPEYDDENGDVMIINQRCIYHDKIHWENRRALAERHEDAWQDYRYLREGDVLINSTGKGTLGRVQIFPGHKEPHVVDGHVTILRTGEELDPYYLMYYLRSGLGQDQIHSNKSGSTGQTELYKKHVQGLEIPVPDLDTQKKLVEKFESIFKQTQKIDDLTKDEKNIVKDLPKSVLAEAFRGDLVDFNSETDSSPYNDVGDTEAEIETEGQQKLGEFD